MPDERPAGADRRLGGVGVDVGKAGIHDIACRQAALAQLAHEPRQAACEAVLHPAEIGDVRLRLLAVGGLQDGARHRLIEGPCLQVYRDMDDDSFALRRR